MKVGVSGFPPLAFRAASLWLGLIVLAATLRLQRVPFTIAHRDWPELGKLAITNMVVWHILAILAVQALSSGRAAILGYTMPIFSAVWGVALFGERLKPRHVAGIVAAACGVALLLWHEFDKLTGRPWAAIGILVAAAVWAFGTQQIRRTRIDAPTLAIGFWMTALTAVALTVATLLFERDRWVLPDPAAAGAIAYNAVLIFGFAQPIWIVMARNLPPVASTMSVMMIPVLGTVSGAWWLNEQLHWQDGAAIVLEVLAIASVMWPSRMAGLAAQPR